MTALLPAVDRAVFAAALGARLRAAGVPVAVPALTALSRAIAVHPPVDVSSLYWLTRVTLVSRSAELAVFDAVFEAVFLDSTLPVRERVAALTSDRRADQPAEDRATGQSAGPVAGAGDALPWHTLPRDVRADDDASTDGRLLPELLPSAVEAVADTPFEDLDEQQLALVGAWLERVGRRWPTRPSRRRRQHPSGSRVAMRSTIAAAGRTGGEIWTLWRSRPTRRRRRVTMLVDVSASMLPYATAYLHLMRALATSGGAETFAFSTRLTRVTPALRHRSAEVAVAQATDQVGDRYGGTQLASSLRALLRSPHGNGLRGGILVVASDGWDSEDPELLAATLRRVRRRVHRLVWLNPRAAAQGFEPLVGSMAAALPFCDVFESAHDARSAMRALEAVWVEAAREPVSSRA